MTFRFFKLALSALLLSSSGLLAQAPLPPGSIPSADDKEKKPKEGYLRFWNLLADNGDELQAIQETGGSEATVILAAEPRNVFVGYKGLKPGRYNLKIVRTTDPKTPLKTFDIILRADVYVSLLAQMKDGKISVDMIDDTYDAEKTLTGRAIFRQHLPGATVVVKQTGLPDFGPLTDGDERQMDNLPLKKLQFLMQAQINGKPQVWPMEVDMTHNPRVSVWIIQDAFGRFRPRVSIDGPVTGDVK